MKILRKSLLGILLVCVAACSSKNKDGDISDSIQRSDPPPGSEDAKFEGLGKLFGEDAFKFGAGSEERETTYGIGVNTYLWRGSLDTVSFIPLQTADPFGGLILTEWYSPAETPNERLKINILIMGRQLRTDAVRAKIFKQVRKAQGAEWKDVEVAAETVIALENTILTRARELRVADE